MFGDLAFGRPRTLGQLSPPRLCNTLEIYLLKTQAQSTSLKPNHNSIATPYPSIRAFAMNILSPDSVLMLVAAIVR